MTFAVGCKNNKLPPVFIFSEYKFGGIRQSSLDR